MSSPAKKPKSSVDTDSVSQKDLQRYNENLLRENPDAAELTQDAYRQQRNVIRAFANLLASRIQYKARLEKRKVVDTPDVVQAGNSLLPRPKNFIDILFDVAFWILTLIGAIVLREIYYFFYEAKEPRVDKNILIFIIAYLVVFIIVAVAKFARQQKRLGIR